MKKGAAVLVTLALALGLCACSAQPAQDDGRLQVVCSLFPYYDFVRQIGGEDVDVSLLVAAGKETHSFEPTPLDVVRLSRADVFIYNGGESELWVSDILDAAGGDIGVVLELMPYADKLTEEVVEGMEVSVHQHEHEDAESHDHDAQAGHDHEDDHDHEDEEAEYDEHIWTSPVVAMTLCRAICDALCQADHGHAQAYTSRLDDYLAELTALDADIRQVVAQGKRTTAVFGDRFPLRYFFAEYGLTYSAAFHGCSGDTEPSLATLKYLIDKVRAEEIPVVYTIELSSQKIAQAVADTTGARVVRFQSCQTLSREDFDNGETYVSLMRRNVDALREGLN